MYVVRDHPRSRGVYMRTLMASSMFRGSSPLARGLPSHVNRDMHFPRIIPARAGFTCSSIGTSSEYADHPRSRGVYVSPDLMIASAWGSSPLARGLRIKPLLAKAAARIIPARAGFTRAIMVRPIPAPDHPRSRGVYGNPLASRPPRMGSPPLARGLPSKGRDLVQPSRIIPARAGFTPPSSV